MVWYGRLPGARRVGMPFLQREIVAAIVQGEAPAGGDDAGAEAHIIAVDQRAGVAVPVDDAEVDGVRPLRLSGNGAGWRRAWGQLAAAAARHMRGRAALRAGWG